ncbi:MAG: hypothetical protein H7Y27_06195 [Gemmatimonadaceae bacterium]|nr:hypothetical protein [Chitinophagaceae bacterium]
MYRKTGIFLVIVFSSLFSFAQDTLPKFTVVTRTADKVIISWSNPYGSSIKQLSIQRSFDSLRNFSTILTLPDPAVPQNGYVDSKFTNNHMFYRLYIQLDSGKYLFSKSKRPVPDTVRVKQVIAPPKVQDAPRIQEEPKPKDSTTTESKPVIKKPEEPVIEKVEPPKPVEKPERIIYIKKRDTLINQIGEKSIRRFKDSIALKTKDTLTYATADTIVLKPFIPKEIYKPSKYIYTDKEGNVKIALPDALSKKYLIRFLEMDASQLFEIKQVRDTLLTLDKTNFINAGWYRFEVYEDGVLKEKHRLYIPKDF